MTALENVLSQEIVQRLGWTLLHFVWQAAATALLLALLLAILRKASANLRYAIACLALGLITLLPAVTMQLIPGAASEPSVGPQPVPAPVVVPVEQLRESPAVEVTVVDRPVRMEKASPAPALPWRQRASEQLEPALPYIVSGWLLGVFALSIWHLGGWTQLQRLRRKMVKPVDASLRTKLDELAEKLAVKRVVQLTESALVQIPTVVGWLRPVILLPASALTGLTSGQLDAILAHELAHIRRHDYLVNILQTIVETLGFYHPAVWWVSHRIRTERENCCDDLAVAVSGDRLGYARALTSMEEIRAARSELAVAASGGDLLERVCRLLGKDSVGGSQAGWMPSVITVLLITTIAIPTTVVLNADSQPQQSELEINVRVEDEESGSVETAGTKEPTAENIRTVHFPEERAVGILKVRMTRRDEESDRGLLSLPGWILLDREAQGDVNVHAGVELRLEVSRDVTDLSFLSDLEPNDLQVLMLSNMNISDEELVHLKGLTGLLGLDLGSTTIEGDGILHLALLESLRSLSLFNTQVSDAGLAHLSALRSLKYLNLCMTQVRGPGLKHLKSLTSLVSLDLAATPITDESLVHLAELPWLRELPIYDTDITDKGLAHLKPLRSLEALILGKSGRRHDYSPITDEGLVHLKKLHSLRDLHLLRTRVTDAGLAHLSTLTKLETLDLKETQITGEGLAFLKDLPALTYLNLKQTGVGRAGLAHLKEMTKLRRLELGEVSMGQADLKELEDALPNCRVNAKSVSSSAGTVSITRATAENPASAGEHETLVRVDCRVLEVYTSMRLDRETLIAAENLLVKKISDIASGKSEPTVEELIRAAAGTHVWDSVRPEEASIVENSHAKPEQLTAMVDLLASRGFVKILMNPTLEVVEGQTGRISSGQSYVQVTPEILDGSKIKLLAEAAIAKEFPRQDEEQLPMVSQTSVSTQVVVKSGMSLIVGGTKTTSTAAEAESKVEDPEKSDTDVLFILTATIVNEQNTAESPVGKAAPELKELGIELKPNDLDGNKIVVCFWDMEQRPSRNLVSELARQKRELEQNHIIVALAHSSDVETDKLRQWLDDRKIPFACGSIEENAERVLYNWGVQAQPWLVLIDERGVVIAGGFGLESLTPEGLEELAEHAKPRPHVFKLKHVQPETMVESLKRILKFRTENMIAPAFEAASIEVVPDAGALLIPGELGDSQLLTDLLVALDVPANSQGPPAGKDNLLIIYVLANVDSEQLAEVLQFLLTDDVFVKALPDQPAEKILVRASKPDHERIERLIRLLDRPRGGPVVEQESIDLGPKSGIIFPKGFDELVERREAATRASSRTNQQEQERSEASEEARQQSRERMETERQTGIAELMDNALAYQKQQHYDEVLGQLEVLVAIDPDNNPGMEMKDELEDRIWLLEQLDEEDAQVNKHLEKTVDVPGLAPGMSFAAALEELEKAAEPPLQIQPNWIDLREAAGIEPTTPVEMKPLTDVTLGKALEVLLARVSSESAKVGYVVDEGVIVVATAKALPRKMITRVYDITDLVGEPADHGGMSRVMQAHNLVKLIQERIEPESWYDLETEGEGTITPYPIQGPKKLAVYNALKPHREIERLLEDMRRSRAEKENPILIETRILMATDDFLKSIELDANSVRASEIWSEHLLADSAAEPNSQPYNLILDDLNVSLLLKATRMPEGKRVKSLAANIRVLAGQPTKMRMVSRAQLQMVPDEYRFRSPRDANERSVETKPYPEHIEVGTFIGLLPYVTADKKNVRLDLEWELRQVSGFEERVGPDRKKSRFPLLAVDTIRTTAVIPDGKTLLIGGKKITQRVVTRTKKPLLGDLPLVGFLFRSASKVEDTRNVLILIKPTINPQRPTTSPPAPAPPDDALVEKLRNEFEGSAAPK